MFRKKCCCLIMISSCQWTAQPSCTLLIISPNTDSWCTAMKPDHVDATVSSFVPAKTTRWRQSWYFLNRIRIRIAFIGQVYAHTYKEFGSGRWCLSTTAMKITTKCKWHNTHTHPHFLLVECFDKKCYIYYIFIYIILIIFNKMK